MRSWTGQNAWKDWSGQLAMAQEDDFERKVLPLLRFLWPGLQQAPRKKSWDARGIDLFVWADHGPFPCAVQCKGFKVQTLGPEQVRQVEASIRKFIASPCIARTYLLVHNRDSRDREFVQRVNALLSEVVTCRKAEKACLWDRQEIVNLVFDHMERCLNKALLEYSNNLITRLQQLFRFGHARIAEVPVVEEEMTFKREPRLP